MVNKPYKKGNKWIIPYEWLKQKYIDEGLTIYEICSLVGCSHHVIYKWLRHYRLLSERKTKKRGKNGIDKPSYEWLYQKHVIEGLTSSQISTLLGVHHQTVARWLKQHDIYKPKLTTVRYMKPKDGKVKVDDFFMGFFDGLMLSDGYLEVNNHYSYKFRLNKVGHKDWLEYIKSIFERYQIGCSIKTSTHYDYLRTCSLKFFKEQARRWYIDGKKHIPKDLNLNDVCLAMWYIGNGCLTTNNGKYYRCTFSTYEFNKSEVEYLQKQLQMRFSFDFKIHKAKPKSDDTGYILALYKQKQVYKLCKLIEPYIPESYKYKVRCLYDIDWAAKYIG